MKNQKGSASIIILGFAAMFALFLFMGLGSILYAINKKDSFMVTENNIRSSYADYQNVHSNYVLKIQEMAQVPQMAKGHLAEIIREAIQGRYGDEGSKAVFQFIQEQNPTIDPALYTNIQKEIAGGRSDFKAAGTRVIDNKRVAYNQLDQTVSGFVLKDIFSLPTIKIGYRDGPDDYKVVISESTSETFKTGIDKGVNILK